MDCARAVPGELAEAGATAHEIMSITGHKTLSEVQRYTAAAEREHLAEQAIAELSERMRTKRHANFQPTDPVRRRDA